MAADRNQASNLMLMAMHLPTKTMRIVAQNHAFQTWQVASNMEVMYDGLQDDLASHYTTMTIANGNVGIGTTNPETRMVVHGDVTVTNGVFHGDLAEDTVTLPMVHPGTLQLQSAGFQARTFTDTVFTPVSSMVYGGTSSGYAVYSVGFQSCITPNNASETSNAGFYYDMRAMDLSQSVLLASRTFSNVDAGWLTLPLPTASLPSNPGVLELQLRKGALGSHVSLSALAWSSSNL